MRKGGNKTKKGRKRKADEANLAEVDDEEAEAEGGRKELVNLEASLDFKLTVDQADKIIKTYDSDGDGRMSFDEFFYYYSSTQRT